MRRHHGGAGFVQITGVERAAQEVLGLLARWDSLIDVDAAAAHPRRANPGIGGDV